MVLFLTVGKVAQRRIILKEINGRGHKQRREAFLPNLML